MQRLRAQDEVVPEHRGGEEEATVAGKKSAIQQLWYVMIPYATQSNDATARPRSMHCATAGPRILSAAIRLLGQIAIKLDVLNRGMLFLHHCRFVTAVVMPVAN